MVEDITKLSDEVHARLFPDTGVVFAHFSIEIILTFALVFTFCHVQIPTSMSANTYYGFAISTVVAGATFFNNVTLMNAGVVIAYYIDDALYHGPATLTSVLPFTTILAEAIGSIVAGLVFKYCTDPDRGRACCDKTQHINI